MNTYPLGQPSPLEGRVHIRQELRTIDVISIGDTLADAFDMAAQGRLPAHELNLDRIAQPYEWKLCLFEITFNTIGVPATDASIRMIIDESSAISTRSELRAMYGPAA